MCVWQDSKDLINDLSDSLFLIVAGDNYSDFLGGCKDSVVSDSIP